MNIIKKFPFPSFGTLVFCNWKTAELKQTGIQKVYLEKLVNFFLLNLVISMIIIMTEKNLVTWMRMVQNIPNEQCTLLWLNTLLFCQYLLTVSPGWMSLCEWCWCSEGYMENTCHSSTPEGDLEWQLTKNICKMYSLLVYI